MIPVPFLRSAVVSGVLPGPTVPGIGPGVLADLGQRGAEVRCIKPGPAQPAYPFIPGALFRVVQDHDAVMKPGAVRDKFGQYNLRPLKRAAASFVFFYVFISIVHLEGLIILETRVNNRAVCPGGDITTS